MKEIVSNLRRNLNITNLKLRTSNDRVRGVRHGRRGNRRKKANNTNKD